MRHTQRASLVGHPDHVSNVCVWLWQSPKVAAQGVEVPEGMPEMHYAQY